MRSALQADPDVAAWGGGRGSAGWWTWQPAGQGAAAHVLLSDLRQFAKYLWASYPSLVNKGRHFLLPTFRAEGLEEETSYPKGL